MKKKTKKRRPEYAALNPRYISKIKQEYLDIDYTQQLNDKEKKWLNDFMAEHLNAEVPAQRDAKKSRFHKSKKKVKQVTDANNARNRDSFSQTRAQGRLMYLSNESMSKHFDSKVGNIANETEDNLIGIMDNVAGKLENEVKSEIESRLVILEKMLKGEIQTKMSSTDIKLEMNKLRNELTLLF